MAILSLPELPKRKMGSPLGQFICGHCRATMPLIKMDKGYVCVKCKHLGNPSAKSSYIEFKYKND